MFGVTFQLVASCSDIRLYFSTFINDFYCHAGYDKALSCFRGV